MFTIKDFFDLDMFKWKRNLTGEEIDGKRPIEYVSVNDLPLDNFIRENEMVITIATPYMNSDELMFQFISGLIDAKASIFLMATPNAEIKLSPANKSFSVANHLPIFQIPWEYRFSDIVEKVLEKISQNDNDLSHRLSSARTKILELYQNDGTMHDALAVISEHLGCAATIVPTPLNTHYDLENKKNKLEYKTVIPIFFNNVLRSYIALDMPATARSKELISSTLSPVMTLWFYKEDIISAQHEIEKMTFVRKLAVTTEKITDHEIHEALSLGIALDSTFICVVGIPRINSQNSEDFDDELINNMIHTILKKTIKCSRQILPTIIKHRIVIFWEIDHHIDYQIIDRNIRNIDKIINETYPRVKLNWGISEISTKEYDFNVKYHHASFAAAVCRDRGDKISHYQESLLGEIMTMLNSDKLISDNVISLFEPLINHDMAKGDGLGYMDVLSEFLRVRNISETARNLNMHRQTLNYQLTKIEKLMGISLKDYDMLLLLDICLSIYKTFQDN